MSRRWPAGEPEAGWPAAYREVLAKHVVEPWFPRCIDFDNGGFLCNFDRRWRDTGTDEKLLEFQARQTTTAAELLTLFPGEPVLAAGGRDRIRIPARCHVGQGIWRLASENRQKRRAASIRLRRQACAWHGLCDRSVLCGLRCHRRTRRPETGASRVRMDRRPRSGFSAWRIFRAYAA